MTIPPPPSDSELRLYKDQNKEWYYAASIFSLGILTTGIFLFATSRPYLWWYLPYGIITLIYLGISYCIGLSAKATQTQILLKTDPGGPSVDVFIPTCGEDINIIQNTVFHAAEMAKHYGNCAVHVLDDGKSAAVADIAREHGCSYITRHDNSLKKAGNLRHAFAGTHAEFILILDADFCPREDMLDRLIGYMSDTNIAIVQSPQFFRVTGNWIEKGAGCVQELFYRLVQVNRDYYEAPICVGSCGLYRRKALKPFGGTAPIAYSEDVHTGFYVMTHAWRVKYVAANLAAGTCPSTVKAFFTQQYRWCMGSISLMVNPLFWNAPNITWIHRACFGSGMLYYIATSLGLLFIPIPSLVVLWIYPDLAHWWNVCFSLPSFIVGTLGVWAWSKSPWGLYVIKVRTVSYWSHLFAIVDKMRGNLMPWVPTGAVKQSSRYAIFRFSFIGYTLVLTGLLIGGAYQNDWSVDVMPMVAVGMFYRLLDLQICYSLVKES